MKYRYVVGTMAVVMLFSGILFAASTRFKGYTFEARVLKASGQQYREFSEKGQIMLKVRPNEEYTIVVHNPLPVRAAVAVTIDGLNSIDGQRTTPRNAKKWMVGPNGTLTVAGWQTGKETLRKFLFTEETAAYAQWREQKEGKPYGKNMGVIGVAWFWNSEELEAALHPPQPFAEEKDHGRAYKAAAPSAAGAPAPAAQAERRAGTGMGSEAQHAVTEVEFNANAGMFAVKDVLKIFYEFAPEPPEPQPFVDDQEDEGRFAPDMYKK